MSVPTRLYCKRGHVMTPDNRYQRANGNIECRQCRNEQSRKQHPRVHEEKRNTVLYQGARLYIIPWGPYFLVVDDGGWPRLIFTVRERAMPCGLCLGWVLLGHGKPRCTLCGR